MIKSLIKAAIKVLPHSFKRKIRKKTKPVKLLFKQWKTAKKWDKYIDQFLSGKFEPFTAIPLKPELVAQKIIWQYWHQGIDENTPKIVINCLNSVKKHCNGYKIILLTENNLNEYLKFPKFIWEKLGKNAFNITKLSNLIRLYLLSAYGGVWIDATIFLSNPIKESWLNKDFFVFQRSKVPPIDADIFKRHNPSYFSWKSLWQVRMVSSFIIAKHENKIIKDILSLHIHFWKNEKRVEYYYIIQVLFNRMMQRPEWKYLNCDEIVDCTETARILIVAFDKFDLRIWNEITAKSNIHKLTYFEKQRPIGSFADFLMNEEASKI